MSQQTLVHLSLLIALCICEASVVAFVEDFCVVAGPSSSTGRGWKDSYPASAAQIVGSHSASGRLSMSFSVVEVMSGFLFSRSVGDVRAISLIPVTFIGFLCTGPLYLQEAKRESLPYSSASSN